MRTIVIIALFCTAAFAQQKGTFTDTRDKKAYKTVKIGEQTWMAENLNYHGEDGFLGLCYGDEPKKKIKKPENCKKYGRLYDWEEANKACPEGWYLPAKNEWDILIDFAGGNEIAGKKLKSKIGWEAYDFSKKNPKAPKCKYKEEIIDSRGKSEVKEYDYCTTDEYGFSALPGGYGNSGGNFLNFLNVGSFGGWWSSSEDYTRNYAYFRGVYYNNERAGYGDYGKSSLYSVRCVQRIVPNPVAGNLGNYSFGIKEDGVSTNYQLAVWNLSGESISKAKAANAQFVLELSKAPANGMQMVLVWQNPATNSWWNPADLFKEGVAVNDVLWNPDTKTITIELPKVIASYNDFAKANALNLIVGYWNVANINELGIVSANLAH
ncbi:MAG: fibrobacter succinogenes major paralogous domain-containing protein [Fibromonadaceae bacterium]|jgi:uncharacterized protein (TIGR02145 family)|nr:fibrobacter succinogenes major paralogous domain-containing protein [Fibromonadaceae bacterium]